MIYIFQVNGKRASLTEEEKKELLRVFMSHLGYEVKREKAS